MSNFDIGRQADLSDIEKRLTDPNASARSKRKMRRTKAKLLEQRNIPELNKLRTRYLKAIREENAEEANKLAEQLKKYDLRYGYDHRKI